MPSERDNEARLQNTIAMEIANVHHYDSTAVASRIVDGSWLQHTVVALAAAVRHPVIWAAIANARQAVELEARPVVTRDLRPPSALAEIDLILRDKGDELARRARLTPGARR